VGELLKANADALERALAARRLELCGIVEDDERDRRADALSLIEEYTALLRIPAVHAAVRNPVRYCFKLVFPDGRWSISEKSLTSPPSEGDVVVFDGYGEISTESAEAGPFYYAEAYHQQYLAKNPDGYCGMGGTGVACPIGLAKA
jgi:hypothetical protein